MQKNHINFKEEWPLAIDETPNRVKGKYSLKFGPTVPRVGHLGSFILPATRQVKNPISCIVHFTSSINSDQVKMNSLNWMEGRRKGRPISRDFQNLPNIDEQITELSTPTSTTMTTSTVHSLVGQISHQGRNAGNCSTSKSAQN